VCISLNNFSYLPEKGAAVNAIKQRNNYYHYQQVQQCISKYYDLQVTAGLVLINRIQRIHNVLTYEYLLFFIILIPTT
jgi:hypothetical protein